MAKKKLIRFNWNLIGDKNKPFAVESLSTEWMKCLEKNLSVACFRKGPNGKDEKPPPNGKNEKLKKKISRKLSQHFDINNCFNTNWFYALPSHRKLAKKNSSLKNQDEMVGLIILLVTTKDELLEQISEVKKIHNTDFVWILKFSFKFASN